MTILVLLTCAASIAYGHFYEPPTPAHRLWPDVSLTTATIGALVAINIALCAAWRVMPLWPIMTRYFMHVPGYPRAIQAIGNVFSHVQYEHLISNMMYLLLAGSVCHDLVGRGIFLGTYVSAGAVGTLASLYWANIGRGNITIHAVGASAAVWGISALYLLLTDTETISIPFVKDLEVAFFPKLLFAAFLVGDILAARRKKAVATVDHASHFGGIAVGMGVAGYLRATGFQERRRRELGLKQGKGEAGEKLDLEGAVRVEVKNIVKEIKG
jgi:rhomboid-like protein